MISYVHPGDSLANGDRSRIMLISIACVVLIGGFAAILFAVRDQKPIEHAWQVSETNVEAAACKAGVNEDWLRVVLADLGRREYAASPSAHGFQAPNPAHDLHTTFGERGIEVVPRTMPSTDESAATAWRFAWTTSAFGRPGRMREVNLGTPEARENRIVYDNGGFVEWYENLKAGLEQGFTVQDRPAGMDQLRIEGTISGGLRPELSEDGAVDLVDARDVCVLRYGQLHVLDADGNEIDSRLAVEGSMIAIVIDDLHATYPLAVDPFVTSPAWTAESDQANAEFGFSVATAGDVNGDGYSDVIVGALWYGNDLPNEGRAFVYHGSAGGLATSPAWTAEGDAANANFGHSVGTAGDVNDDGYSDVIIGAPSYSNGQVEEGRAVVYHGSAAGLATSPAWTAESNLTGAEFGTSVATAGDVNGDGYSDVIVGAIQYSNGQSYEGQVSVYHGSAAGLGTSPDWVEEIDSGGAYFGASVATAGDVNGDGYADVIVGAPGFGANDPGRAFVYHGSVSGLAKSAAWTAESDRSDAELGSSVATAGDVNDDGYSDVIVGVHRYDNGHFDEGKAFVYHGSSTGLATSAVWGVEGNQVSARYGTSVSSAGDVNADGYSDVIVGAPRYDNDLNNEGRVFVYLGSGAGLATTPTWTAESDYLGTPEFGISVATAGDVNDDRYSDVIVGAPFYANGQAGEGRAFVYHGPSGSPSRSAAIEAGKRGGMSEDLAPAHRLLGLSSPNPFATSTMVAYTLVDGGRLHLAVYDVQGREIAVLASGTYPAGQHTARWDGMSRVGTPMPGGVYFLRLEFGGRTETQRIVITR